MTPPRIPVKGRPSGLLLIDPTYRATERIVTLPNGRRARIHVDDSRTVTHIEDDDTLSAVVRPRTTIIRIRGER